MKVIFSSRRAIRAEFSYPPGGRPRALVVDERLRSGRSTVVISPDRRDLLAEHRPEILAASYSQLIAVRECHPTRAVVAFTTAGDPLLAPEHRDRLWDLFEVPVFEQVLSADGELMAWECEAHHSLHVIHEWRGLDSGDVEDGACDCGTTGRRIPVTDRALAACAG